MAVSLTIDRDNKLPNAQDYDFLSKEGIGLIQSLSGEIWTDYNTHDPGITLLETICYALTDLGYRTGFNIADILAPNKPGSATWENVFYSARHILPTNPVTLLDYRKLIIDTEGVRNAWVEKSDDYEILMYVHKLASSTDSKQRYKLTYDAKKGQELLLLRGLYKVFVEYEDYILQQKKEEEVADEIRKKLQANRNLCEDFISVTSIEYEDFSIDAIIQVNEASDTDLINAKIFKVIHDFFSPPIIFYSLEQMLERYGTADEVFNGPALKYGFIDTEELKRSEKYKDIHLSDIIQLISGVEGVIAVKRFSFGKTQSPYNEFTEWVNDVTDMQKTPRLDAVNSKITFVRSGDRHRPDSDKIANKERVLSLFAFLQSADFRSRLKGVGKDIPIPVGEFMDIGDYYPFQNNLPVAYGMAEKYIDDAIDLTTIVRATTELLDFAVGADVRRVLIKFLDEAQENKEIISGLDNLMLSQQENKNAAKEVISSILNDKVNSALMSQIVKELLGEERKKVGLKERLFALIENSAYQSTISDKTKSLANLVLTTNKQSLLLLTETKDIEQLRALYQRNQIDTLAKNKKLALQLRGFLMVFEQIMADHLAKLAHTRELLSFESSVRQNSFPQVLAEINDLEAIFVNFKDYRDAHLRLIESGEEFAASRNAILDHLLSRFSESMDKYAYFMRSYFGKSASRRLIADKTAFLSDYEEISTFRSRGFNYTNEDGSWNTNNVPGLKKRICRLLGINNYSRRTIAPPNIFVKEVSLDDHGNKKYVAVLTDPHDTGNTENILLQSVEYENAGEAGQILTYILEHGMEKELYRDEKKKDKYRYQLKRPTLENDFEVVAGSQEYHSAEDREKAFNRTLQVLNRYTEDENFHVIEHILLRPKIASRESTVKKGTSGLDLDEVNLLSVRNVPDSIITSVNAPKEVEFQFRITQQKGQKDDVIIWKLSLNEEEDEVLNVPEDFTFFRHLSRRIRHIREFGSDMSNYKIDTKADGLFTFKIVAPGRELAEGRRGYRKKEDLNAVINKLVNFFSYEPEHAMARQQDDSLGYHADPYSLQISIVLPNWHARFRSPAFMHLLEKTIYMETPSHIHPHIYWLDHNAMKEFEEAYKLWVDELQGPETPDTDIVNKMVMAVNELRKL